MQVSEYAWPFVRDHGDLVLPFALSNALTSGAWYAFLEATMGINFMAGMLNSTKAPVRLLPPDLMSVGQMKIMGSDRGV